MILGSDEAGKEAMKENYPEYTDFDRQIWERELENFLPETIIDVHTHIWDDSFADRVRTPQSVLRTNVDLEDLNSWTSQIFPGRKRGFVLLPTPLLHIDRLGHNSWVAAQGALGVDLGLQLLRTGMLVHPDDSPDEVLAHIRQSGTAALKPYRIYAKDPADARIAEYLPEAIMEVADSEGVAVVLHLSKRAGPADRENIEDMELYNRKYPNIQWIMAHCIRAFNSVHLEESVQRYAAMPNVWVDTSAINDLYTQYLILKHFDRQKVLFGSDNIAAGSYRGKYISFGNGWKAFYQNGELEHCDRRCTFVIYEQLRCQKQAAEMLSLDRLAIESIFFRNAFALFGA